MKPITYLIMVMSWLALSCKKQRDRDQPQTLPETKEIIKKDSIHTPWSEQFQDFLDSPKFAGKNRGESLHGYRTDVHSFDTEIEFGGSNHGNSSADPQTGYLNEHQVAGTRGIFELKPGRIIKFKANPRAYNAHFDPGIILSGEYYYKAKGDSLILHKILKTDGDLKIFQYRLKYVKTPE